MIILIDNYDSFTYNVNHYFNELELKSKSLEMIKFYKQMKKLNPKAIVISPGPCTPNEAGICLNLIKNL